MDVRLSARGRAGVALDLVRPQETGADAGTDNQDHAGQRHGRDRITEQPDPENEAEHNAGVLQRGHAQCGLSLIHI